MDIDLKADLSKAIDQLAEKLGLATKEILPHYTKYYYVEGVTGIIHGVIIILLPLLLFVFSVEGFTDTILFMGLRLVFTIIMILSGIYTIFEDIKKVIAPKAEAIDHLINQLRKIKK